MPWISTALSVTLSVMEMFGAAVCEEMCNFIFFSSGSQLTDWIMCLHARRTNAPDRVSGTNAICEVMNLRCPSPFVRTCSMCGWDGGWAMQNKRVFVLTYLYAWKSRDRVLLDDIRQAAAGVTHHTFYSLSLYGIGAQINTCISDCLHHDIGKQMRHFWCSMNTLRYWRPIRSCTADPIREHYETWKSLFLSKSDERQSWNIMFKRPTACFVRSC